MIYFSKTAIAFIAIGTVSATSVTAKIVPEIASALASAVSAPSRTPASKARDKYRHPAETLAFFGVKPGDTVVEIWPGGGWYTEILSPYVAAKGKLIIAAPPGRSSASIATKLDADPVTYGKVVRANFPTSLGGGTTIAAGTADVVLTFRNVHNWRMGEYTPDKADYSEAAFREIFAMLKPGGRAGDRGSSAAGKRRYRA